ncbi:MAG: ABC transporter substrate-binding protein [Paracoccaceae bacterium]|nr:ABC transporter substrate-binding protein [Paracoccaceae bacterium]
MSDRLGWKNRREFMKYTAATGVGLAALGPGSFVRPAYSQDFKGEELRIFTYAGAWGDQFTKNFAPLFEELTGAKLIVELGWWDSVPKLKASPPGKPAFDLIMTDATQGYPAIREGLFQTVDFGKIPNASKFSPNVMDNWVVKDAWGVTWPDAAQTGVYNTEIVKEAPTRWADLLDERFTGKLGMYNSFYFSLFTFASIMVDAEGKAGTARQRCAEDIDGVLQYAKEQSARVNYWWPSSSDMALNLVQRNVSVGNIHSVDAFGPVREGEPIGVFVPDTDRASFQALWLASKDTQKKELAEVAIDIFCSEAFQEIYASDGGFPTGIPSVAKKVAAGDELWASINPYTDAHFDNVGYYPYDAYFADWDNIVQFWDKEVLRKS